MSSIIDELKHDHHDFGDDHFLPRELNDPWEAFDLWMKEAADKGVREPNATSVSTVNQEGVPSTRMVYLKEFVDGSPVFYTNYESAKGQDLIANPNICLLIFWPELSRQIKMIGKAKHCSKEISEAYFTSRPYGSKIGAWASQQSRSMESKQELLDRVKLFEEKYPKDVPCPPHWGGIQVEVDRIEFWQGQASRLHDRVEFTKSESNWTKQILNP